MFGSFVDQLRVICLQVKVTNANQHACILKVSNLNVLKSWMQFIRSSAVFKGSDVGKI